MGIGDRLTLGTLGQRLPVPSEFAMRLPTPYVWPAFMEPIWVSTSIVTIANTITESALLGGGLGEATIPAEALTVGSSIIFDFSGCYTTDPAADNRISLLLSAKDGGSFPLIDLSDLVLPASGGAAWMLRGGLTIKTKGTPGTCIVAASLFVLSTDEFTPAMGLGIVPGAAIPIDTSGDTEISLTAEWHEASVLNAFTITLASLGVIVQ